MTADFTPIDRDRQTLDWLRQIAAYQRELLAEITYDLRLAGERVAELEQKRAEAERSLTEIETMIQQRSG